MNFQSKSAVECFAYLKTGERGLSEAEAKKRLTADGLNEITEKREKGLFGRILSALKEPMLVILLFGFFITLGANIGKAVKTGEGDFTECVGIILAVALSVAITLVMEGSSRKAFRALKRISAVSQVKVVRDGRTVLIPVKEIVKGDILLLESGDKIAADGRLFSAEELSVDESSLTGESRSVKKDADAVLAVATHLAERKHCVYSGTFVPSGRGAVIVTATGDRTEIGKIAGELTAETADSPLNKKLAKLSKTVAIIGSVAAAIVFVFSAFRLWFTGNFDFDGISELFISCIVLIIAAVPEGLPTIVAISLALNMIRLAGENTLIKKMIATETTGAVSVICSDKTGTLTENRMTVVTACDGDGREFSGGVPDTVLYNSVLNSTAEESAGGEFVGGGTEIALMKFAKKNGVKADERKNYPVVFRSPFSSDKKYMVTAVKYGGKTRVFLKGAPERVLALCGVTRAQSAAALKQMEAHQKKARRILAFAHFDTDGKTGAADRLDISENKFCFDGYFALADPVRSEVAQAVSECKKAGIKVKMLTGDNLVTALAVAKETGIARDGSQAVVASDIENMTEEQLRRALDKITVIARSTPTVKYRVVKALKKNGEVVAVTGDGINDAPAIRHADVGIAMGKSGSEIAKEAADAVLIDDSFKSVVKAVEFGRNVYRNIQRFVLFQLSVNVAALIFVTACAVLGLKTPFNTLQLLWINVIMDGPPALTLGLEPPSANLMKLKPVKRTDGIVNARTLLRILISGAFVGGIMLWQYLYNFLGAKDLEKSSATFTLFIFFQLFNAFNCRELGDVSIFRNIGRNRVMLATFSAVFLAHLVIVELLYKPFGLAPMSFTLWVKCVGTALTIIALSETYKAVYRRFKGGILKKTAKNRGNVAIERA
ncbi:MAG: calcium-translocating P-type ATPase, PMCA-type [Clostridia bacterium]|nr:calcium-translocating P-type ATPase, PMCA-type [Clostridia bacterium]